MVAVLAREAYEVTSSRTRRIALLNLVINGFESIIGEYGCRDLRALLPEVNGVLEIHYSGCEETPEEGFELDAAVEYGLIEDYRFSESYSGLEGLSISDLYREAAELVRKEVTSTLSPYALRCALTNVEYMLVILQNGSAAILEGERNKVSIPLTKASVTAHTHPRGCIPSPHDIRSLINLLFEGGLGSAIISTECGLLMIRKGPFTEDDLIALSKMRDSLSGKDLNELRNLLSSGVVGRNIMIKLIT